MRSIKTLLEHDLDLASFNTRARVSSSMHLLGPYSVVGPGSCAASRTRPPKPALTLRPHCDKRALCGGSQ
jgi:hypothetical protein